MMMMMMMMMMFSISARELPCERGLSAKPEACDQDAGVRDRDVRRVLAPHPGDYHDSDDNDDDNDDTGHPPPQGLRGV